ncbi:hypothetical protein GCM10023087_34770 [Microbacterium rhizosphaerae]
MRREPVPIVAFVATFEIATDTTGVSARFVPADADFDSSVIALSVLAERRSPRAPVSAAPSPTVADPVSFTMLTDTPAPTPVESLGVCWSCRKCQSPAATLPSSGSTSSEVHVGNRRLAEMSCTVMWPLPSMVHGWKIGAPQYT